MYIYGTINVIHVTVEIQNVREIDKTIETMKRVIRGEELIESDGNTLQGIMSILKGIKRNYEGGYDCRKVPVWVKDGVQELAKYFTSGNGVPVERATILAKDFFRITGLTLEDVGRERMK